MGKGGEASFKKLNDNDSSGVVERRPEDTAATRSSTITKYTWEEVKKHCTPDDAWVVYKDKVYDVSSWFDHPGGAVIFTHAGDDMTDIFAAMHAPGSDKVMRKFYIGDLIIESVEHKDQAQRDFEQGYRDLRAQMVKMGYFKASLPFYAYKCVSNLMIWATACAIPYYFPDNVLLHLVSSIMLGLFFQQCGWLAHDFLHQQVFQRRRYGDYGGIFWGNLMQGYSVQWWKNKHNGHHAVPNLHSTTALSQDGDPDIDTMPVLAWSLKQAQSYREISQDGKDTPLVKFLVSNQAIFYFPILLVARLSWMNESFKVAFNVGAPTANAALELKTKGVTYPILERGGIILHYLWVFAVSSGYGRWSWWYGLTFFMIMTCSCGLMLAIVFGLGHNGMATYDAVSRPDFWKLQVTTTRNITGGHGIPQAFVDWFCGGLQYQVEHHLFPTIPRHHLPKAHVLVESFCQKWGVKYHEADMIDGTIEVLYHLQHVSDEFIREFLVDGPTM